MAAGYAVLKAIHVGAVALSGAGFFARGLGMLAGARWVHGRLARVAPHLVDTTLLVSAVALAWTLRVSPLTDAWLAAKLIGLLAYVGLGLVALRFGRTRTFDTDCTGRPSLNPSNIRRTSAAALARSKRWSFSICSRGRSFWR